MSSVGSVVPPWAAAEQGLSKCSTGRDAQAPQRNGRVIDFIPLMGFHWFFYIRRFVHIFPRKFYEQGLEVLVGRYASLTFIGAMAAAATISTAFDISFKANARSA